MPSGVANGTRGKPSLPSGERREAERFQTMLKFAISRTDPCGNGLLVEPVHVRDISRVGALVTTRHQVEPSENVLLSIPTDQCPDSMGLPRAFVGSAEVVRTLGKIDHNTAIALRFSEVISHNREFAVFLDFLREVAGQ